MTSTTTTQRSDQGRGITAILPEKNPLQLLASWEPLASFVFHILSFIAGITLFVVLVTFLSVGISLTLSVVMAVVGIPILGLLLLLIPFAGQFERARIGALTGIEIGDPYKPREDGKIGDRIIAFLSDGALWRDLLYAGLLFPIGVFEFVVAVTGASISLTMIGAPFIVLAGGEVNVGGGGFYTVDSVGDTLPMVLIGFLFLIASAWVFVLLARAHGIFARWLIGPSDRDQLAARVETLSETRSRMVDVSLEDRRSIERDIHDSTQPKLVSLAMNLGMAKEKIDSDPEQARELVDNAHREAREVLSEIRNLVRGLHPSILTDRGLEAAIQSLAGYCSVPVTVDVDLPQRPPPAVETTAYYIVSEALSNVVKHSQASEAHVIVQSDGQTLTINVVDDGTGGAQLLPGSGLAGLQDRAAALDGSLEVTSPQGGPTRIKATLPCEL